MGSYLSQQSSHVEELDSSTNAAYTYPPKSGSYFASHFFMGGKKFDTVQPESYLFGDNADLNFLGPRPQTFTYRSPNDKQPVRALKCLVNIRKDSLRLIRVPNPPNKPENVIRNTEDDQSGVKTSPLYNLEFTFDADCPCSITVYYNAAEEMCNKSVLFTTKSGDERSDTVHYNAGCNQQFCVPSHVINPALLHNNEQKPWSAECVPIVIQACAECGAEFAGHSHIAYAAFDKNSDDSWSIKATKQKQAINGVTYLFQEIYGIENKKTEVNGEESGGESDDDDNAECVVCLSDDRDTLILPCKHLCLCSSCANQLRFQQSGCPICRQPFKALLQIRAVRKRSALSPSSGGQDEESNSVEDTTEAGSDDTQEVAVPAGYEVIPLISAINGPATSASFATLSLNTGSVTGETLSSESSSSTLRRSSRRKKNKTPTVDVENEVASTLDGAVERKKSRSKRKKKQVDEVTEQVLTNVSSVTVDHEDEDRLCAAIEAAATNESDKLNSGEARDCASLADVSSITDGVTAATTHKKATHEDLEINEVTTIPSSRDFSPDERA